MLGPSSLCPLLVPLCRVLAGLYWVLIGILASCPSLNLRNSSLSSFLGSAVPALSPPAFVSSEFAGPPLSSWRVVFVLVTTFWGSGRVHKLTVR